MGRGKPPLPMGEGWGEGKYMQKVILPKTITFKKDDKEHQGQVIVEPCCPGYGTTLGNSLRRVLLSSLQGAAVVGVKINGADHEFTTLPNIKEDILEIILNLKGLRMKFFGEEDEVVKLELKVEGEKRVTAKDIAKNSKIEIVNPNLHIAEITNSNGSLEIDIFVASGYGYSSIESKDTQEKEVGYIEIDSLFSPIKAVKVNIENVRVGQMTDWEKLIIEIKTDGTISFIEAFKQVMEILVEQFGFLLEKVNEEVGEKGRSTKSEGRSTKDEAGSEKSEDDGSKKSEIKSKKEDKKKDKSDADEDDITKEEEQEESKES